jgi:tripartite-type tricarboxylate transporter receptor subunit TctC
MVGRLGLLVSMFNCMVLGATAAWCQNYPNRPVRIVAPPAGGGSDFVARFIAQGISGPLGQPVIIENRGAAQTGGIVSKAQPDGYTVLLAGSSIWVTPLLQKTAYDALKDFAPITIAERSPNILVVHPSVAVTSVRELIALAKAKPGELNYASSGNGTSAHLAAELFKAMAGVNILHVPYKGTAPALSDLIGGQVQLMFSSTPPLAPHIKSGKLRALAVSTPEPSALAPSLPTIAASGLPGYESVPVTGIFVPAGTPAPVIARLNQEIARFLKTPESRDKFLSIGSEAVGSAPEELAARMKADTVRLTKLIKDGGIRAD